MKAYLIERNINGVAHWWMREDNQFGNWADSDRWTTDPNKARKYKSKADAEYVIGHDMSECIVTEHIWIKP
jgi:hypothetical protein